MCCAPVKQRGGDASGPVGKLMAQAWWKVVCCLKGASCGVRLWYCFHSCQGYLKWVLGCLSLKKDLGGISPGHGMDFLAREGESLWQWWKVSLADRMTHPLDNESVRLVGDVCLTLCLPPSLYPSLTQSPPSRPFLWPPWLRSSRQCWWSVVLTRMAPSAWCVPATCAYS